MKIFAEQVRIATCVCLAIMGCTSMATAQLVKATWALADESDAGAVTLVGNESYTSLVSTSLVIGSNLTIAGMQTSANAAEGYTGVTYDTPFMKFQPAADVSVKTDGYCISYTLAPSEGHTFKPTTISFDAAKLGTDGGGLEVYLKAGSLGETAFKTGLTPLRNKIQEGNLTGYSAYSFSVADYLLDGEPFTVVVYITGVAGSNNKQMGLRNLSIEGMVDEPIYDLSYYLSSASCSAGDLYALIKHVGNGQTVVWSDKLAVHPTNFEFTAIDGYTVETNYEKKTATVVVKKDESVVYTAYIRFSVAANRNHGTSVPLNRGVVAIPVNSGVQVSWRMRASDEGCTYRLFRDGEEVSESYYTSATCVVDTKGTEASVYSLEVLKNGEVIERETGIGVWSNFYRHIPLNTPTDQRGLGCSYTPNDCSAYDMDGDGEYEIIVKWDPDNSKDSAGSGVTGSVYIDCYKLDGTLLWRIDLGQNIRAGAHYTQFLCYDFDGDGFGEMVCKTAPGTVDGQGNFVLMGTDDPNASYINGKGHITSGPEYLTIFDGVSGEEISTVKYDPAYGDVSTSVWGDSNANRSDRYKACVAFLDGIHPSAVMMRGYYCGSFAAAYDFNGSELVQRWYHQSPTKGQGTYGEGHHSVAVGDVDGDGYDEIVVGSACIDHDGSTLWRGGTGHGDALHLGDFDYDNPGMEVFAVYESGSAKYDAALRDAKTGSALSWATQTGGDTGRGLILDCDANHRGFEWMHSSSESLYAIDGTIICPWQQGTVSSSSINFRIYWDGDLYDEYHDRQHIDKWDSETQSFGRLVTLYNEGGASSINSTKHNPNLQADILGDWREEAVYWVTESDGTQALTIFTTNQSTVYALPTLRDDHVYDMAVVWQNVGYNQPPHLSYSLIDYFTTTLTAEAGCVWYPFYSDYAVELPEGVEAYIIRSYSKNGVDDTVTLNKVETDYIPARKAMMLRLPSEEVAEYDFIPSVKTKTVDGISINYLRGVAASDTVTSSPEGTELGEYFYEFRKDEELGYGFFLVDTRVAKENTGFMRVKETRTFTHAPYYLLGTSWQEGGSSDIGQIRIDEISEETEIYDLNGVRVLQPGRGIYIVNGKKTVIEE